MFNYEVMTTNKLFKELTDSDVRKIVFSVGDFHSRHMFKGLTKFLLIHTLCSPHLC